MATSSITVVMRDYDYLAPLYSGDVAPDGVQLILDRKTRITQSAGDPSILASELSFSRFLIGLSQGDRSFVGIPFFPTRAFRHRCFFVRRDSRLRDLRALQGTRIGTNSWPDTGNTWTRAALRDQGVAIDRIRWTVGVIDDSYPPGRPQADLPAYVTEAPAGRTLRDMLLDRDLDALMVPFPPKGFYDPDGPIVRVLGDYRAAELDYYRRTRIYPIHHIVGLRRQVFERDPQVAVAIYKTLEAARLYWQRQRFFMAELTPWVLTDMEETVALMGPDWQPGGVRANAHITRTLCDEELAQRLIEGPLDPDTVFAEFDAVLET
jgi:4,5-dihydroxyphthalate decarboxylase